MSIIRLPGEVPLFDIVPFEREKFEATAEHQGRQLTAELLSFKGSVDHATRAIHNGPLFAAADQTVDRLLFREI